MRRPIALVTLYLVASLGVTTLGGPAAATFGGSNGRIALIREGAIVTLDPSGAGEVKLTNGPGDAFPAWSPSGEQLVFIRDNALGSAVWVMNSDGTNKHRVSNYASGEVQFPAWSHDGRWIAYADYRDATPSVAAIWKVSIDGIQRVRLTTYGQINTQPSWSPDDAQIAFDRGTVANNDIWTMTSDGANKTQLTSFPGPDDVPSWAPDGSSIAFTHVVGRHHIHACTIDTVTPDGSLTTALTNARRCDLRPQWAPNSSAIVFRGDVLSGGSTDLYVVTPSKTLTQLTSTGTEKDSWAWSPDSTTIVFDEAGRSVFTISSDGTGLFQVTTDPTFVGNADWQALH